MRDEQRGLLSEPTEVPLGIRIIADGRASHLDYSVLPDTPLRRQFRDANLAVLIDQGGNAKSRGSAKTYWDAARAAHAALAAAATPLERPLDIRTLTVPTLHRALYENKTSPASVRTTLARRLLQEAAEAEGNIVVGSYLQNLRLHGYSKPSNPYTADELECVLNWCKTRLNDMYLRQAKALELLGTGPDDTDVQVLRKAQSILDESKHRQPAEGSDEYRWWLAQLYANGFEDIPAPGSRQRAIFTRAMKALFPTSQDAVAAVLLVINEYGAEGQLLASLDFTDVRRDALDSSVMVITGIKSRADKAVSRRGNAVATWSGGKVLERWIAATAPARRWTGTSHLWLWQSIFSRSDKTVVPPFHTFIPDRPLIIEGNMSVIPMPDGGRVRLSTRRMRKTWVVRADRAFGAGISGAVDPAHDQRTAWTFYRSVTLEVNERHSIIAEAQEDYMAMIAANGIVIDDTMSPEQAISILTELGIAPAAAQRVLRGAGDDSGTAKCRDSRKAPGQAEGTLCRKTPFACITCPNAIHTTAHLPVILALKEYIDQERRTLPAEQFISLWAGTDLGVERVIHSFSSTAIETARQDMAKARARIDKLREVYA
jgi:hypothetical protein